MSQAARNRSSRPAPAPVVDHDYASFEILCGDEVAHAPDFSAAEHAFFASGDALAHDSAAWRTDSFADLDSPGTSPSVQRRTTGRLAAV